VPTEKSSRLLHEFYNDESKQNQISKLYSERPKSGPFEEGDTFWFIYTKGSVFEWSVIVITYGFFNVSSLDRFIYKQCYKNNFFLKLNGLG
jgi:hypothetical protein